VATALAASGVRLAHLGISDPGTAPSEHFVKVWEHFGITADGLLAAIL